MAINWDKINKKAKELDKKQNVKSSTSAPPRNVLATTTAPSLKREVSMPIKMPTLGEKLNVQSRMPQPAHQKIWNFNAGTAVPAKFDLIQSAVDSRAKTIPGKTSVPAEQVGGRKNELQAEIKRLSERNQVLGMARGSLPQIQLDEYNRNAEAIRMASDELKSLERAVTHSERDEYGWRLEDAKTAQKKTTSELMGIGAGARVGNAEATRNALIQAAQKDVETRADVKGAKRDIERVEYVDKYHGRKYDDNFGGQFMASNTVGRLSQDQSMAWSKYLDNPSPENRKYAETIDQLIQQFQENNIATLDEDAQAKWISQSLAGYLPQLQDQLIHQGIGGLAGGAVGLLVGNPVAGAKAGAIAGSGKYSYDTMRGAAFRSLLELGVDEETARKAASDEAVLSAAIEMADTAVDIATLGTGSLLNMLGKGGAKVAAKKGATTALKKFAVALGKYGINILGEGVEEMLQEGVSIANENRLMAGEADSSLVAGSARTLWDDMILGKNAENRARVIESGVEGMKIGAMVGGATMAGTSLMNRALAPNLQHTVQTPSTIAPALQDIAQQPAQQPTSAQNSLEVKLPTDAQNAARGIVEPVVDSRPMAVPKEQTGPHIDERGYSDVSSRKVNAFQFDNPELHEHYAVVAKGLQNDLRMATKGERFGVKDSDGYYVDSIGIKRSVSPEIEALLDNAKLSYAQIEKGLADLIADHGQENYAAAKKIELVLDDMLTNGYEVEGYQIEPDYEYIQKKEAIKSGEHSNEYEMTEDEWNALLKSEPSTSPSLPSIFPENSLGAKITQQGQQLPQGMGAASNSFVPEQKVSKVFTNTYQKTDSLTDEQRAQMKPENYQYDVRGHAQNETAAQQRVDVDFEGEIADLNAKQEWTGEDVFTSKKILDKISADAEKSGDFAELNKWTKAIQERGTRGGQTVEAFKAFQKTPEGAVIKAQQVVAAAEAKLTTKKEVGKKVQTSTGRKITDDIDNVTKIVDALTSGKETTGMAKTLNKVTLKEIKQLVASGKYDAEAINNLVKEKYGIPTLTATDVQKIYELNKLAQETSNDYQKRVYLNRAARVISDKLPVTGKQKVLAVRRIAMLLNPKTLISRNAGGNIVFGILDDIKDAPGTLIDLGVSKITGQRTTSYNPWATSKAEFLGMKKGLAEWGKDIKNKVDTSPTEHEMPRTPSFKGAVGRGFEEALNKLLQLGDRPFYEAAKEKRLDELKRLGLDYTSEDAIAEANVYALERVFQNNSTLAKKAVQLRDSLGVLGDIAIPFAQTPANIFDKLIDYSPYGFVRAIKKAGTVKDSAWSQKQFVDTLSRSLTGTGILTFAYFAAQAGLISGGEDREEDEGLSYQKKISGWQPYSIVIGDKTYTYDWMTVGGALLSLGADIAQSENAGDTMLAILSAGAKAGINTMFNQSYLEGISELFGGEDIASGLESVLLGLPASFTPTAFQQIAKIIDPIARDTYDTDPFKRAWNKVKAKLPYASKTLPAKIGASGDELTNFQGSKATNIFESVLSPGYIGENQKTAIDTEAHRLYRATGDLGVLPKWSKYTSKGDMVITIDGEKLVMSTSEWGQYQKTRGKQTYKMLDELIKSPDYKSMTDAQKADAMQGIIGYASDIAKGEYVKAKGKVHESSTYAKVREVEAAGISPVKYFEYQNALKKERPEGGTPSQLQFSKAINTLNISDKQKGKLWEIQNGESSDKNPFTGELATMGMKPKNIIGATEKYEQLLEVVTDETATAAGANKSEIRSSYIRQWLKDLGYNQSEISKIIESLGFAKKTSSKSDAYVAANPR